VFEAHLNDIGLLRDSIGTICELIDETEFQISKDGIRLLAADRAVVAVVDFFLSANAFKEYKCQKDMKIGINLLDFLAVLKRAAPGDVLTLKIGEENKLNIILKGASTRNFVLPLLDISKEEPPPIDKLEFSANFDMDSEILNNGIEDASLITDSVVLTAQKGRVLLKAESDIRSSELELLSGMDGLKNLEVNEPVRARYSVDYLKKMMKGRKLAPYAHLALSMDYPLNLSFNMPNKMKLQFILAPRVEE
jgi:proliferating cell nuclear antigen